MKILTMMMKKKRIDYSFVNLLEDAEQLTSLFEQL
jgi:hypothetical protein